MSGLVSKERLILDFHKLEGDFFHRLVHDLAQDQTSMRWVIAFWLWLESAGHHNFVRRAYALPGTAVLRLVEEAVACLGCLAGEGYDAGDTRIASLPCTNAFLAEPIDDLGYFVERREEVLKGVNYMYKTVSLVVCLGNAANRAPAGAAGGARAAAPPKTSSPDDGAATLMMSSPEERASPLGMTTRARGAPQMTSSPDRAAPLMMITPGRGAPLMMNTPCRAAAPMPSTLNPMASPWVPMMQEQSPLPEDYRSLFVTFSKGYPVGRDDIMEFFSWMFGPCVETVIMEKVQPGEMPVYGRVVLHSPAMIPVVLKGQQTAKFLIKGRHLWARVYVPSSTGAGLYLSCPSE